MIWLLKLSDAIFHFPPSAVTKKFCENDLVPSPETRYTPLVLITNVFCVLTATPNIKKQLANVTIIRLEVLNRWDGDEIWKIYNYIFSQRILFSPTWDRLAVHSCYLKIQGWQIFEELADLGSAYTWITIPNHNGWLNVEKMCSL